MGEKIIVSTEKVRFKIEKYRKKENDYADGYSQALEDILDGNYSIGEWIKLNTKKLISFIDKRIEYWEQDNEEREEPGCSVIEELEQLKQFVLIHG